MRLLYTLLTLALPTLTHAKPLVIDGKLNEADWRSAQEFTDFRQVQPLTGKASPYQTRARLLSTPEGLAVGFDVHQPKTLTRSKPATPRDQASSADRVNVYVDYDGTGQAAYNFTVSLANGIEDGTLVNENNFSTDWDGDWQHAVTEHEHGYTVEVLLPWSLAAMQRTDGDKRPIGIHFDQVIQATGERFSLNGISYNQSRYISAFQKTEVRQYEQALFNSYPYVSVLSDQVAEKMEYRAGVDLFWKPRSDFQLTASINPDFGQVESDDLVVDFSAVETYFSDKRPFFTENQELFRLTAPDDAELIYTRRIGGYRDDGTGPADIDAALKLNGSSNGFEYGYLGAWERDYSDGQGKAFNVLRGRVTDGDNRLGYVITDADRPFLGRQATVHGADFDTSLGDVRLRGQALESRIDTVTDAQTDSAGWLQLDGEHGSWQHELLLGHYGDEFDLDDVGYLRRNDLNLAEYELTYFDKNYSADSAIGSAEWTLLLNGYRNDSGLDLGSEIEIMHRAEWRSGSVSHFEITQIMEGWDDLISRGHGDWLRPARTSIYGDHETTRIGDWKLFFSAWSFEEGLSERFHELEGAARYFISDSFNVRLSLARLDSKDLLIWHENNAFGRYERTQWKSSFDATWIPEPKQELRLKLQWLGLVAENGRDYHLEDGDLHATSATRPDFTINNLGVQLRYRYQLAPLSDLFVVYSRGGYQESEPGERKPDARFDDALQLRDADQIFVKLRYKI